MVAQHDRKMYDQPPRARLPARLHPTVRPAESQPRTRPHWHVAVPSVAPARVAALAVGPRRFCAPLAAVSQPQLGLRSEPHNQKFQSVKIYIEKEVMMKNVFYFFIKTNVEE